MPFTGAHVSISGGYHDAAKSALAQGGGAFQYFPKNPRSLTIKTYDAMDAQRCAEFCIKHDLRSIAHAPYPTNLAASDPDQVERTITSLLNDLAIAESCGSLGVVVHFGIYKGPDTLQGYKNIIQCLDKTLEQWNGRAKLLIENQAGDHALMGMTFEELSQIRGLSRYPEKIAFCLDTCHLFASGVWSMASEQDWLQKARDTGVMRHLAAVHFNDSAFPSGSRRDRHAVIGEGHIGEQALMRFLAIPEVRDVPIILETPRSEDGTHCEQIKCLNEWMHAAHSPSKQTDRKR
ncbi:deoxyribonuclease IV [Paenibacillus abyssi]|uniref:Endonuclease 4 n=1 Tax=Paenibacillus abyssi TaxID=1340531 RepID=A0A917CIA3_9BACL|nr:deoxyribonuclease IV [Paenibacillus abyssi]GGF89863.1 putative endonuclease 4 [Paenibacillus abyssi]